MALLPQCGANKVGDEPAVSLGAQSLSTQQQSMLTNDAQWSGGVHLEPIANLAHELRTPVQVLLGYIDILRDHRCDRGGSGSADRTIIERMNANVHELAQTVENVLDFALAYAGAETAIEEEIDPAEFAGELEEILQASNRNQKLALRIDIADAPPVVITRRRPLRSIVLNLATNALKFTASGAVTISIARSTEGPHSLEIQVSDTGAGISRELLANAFEPLVQLSQSSTRHHRGLGLGLAMVLRNVQTLGGRLQVDSIPGAGSCFKVIIPCSHSASHVCTSSHRGSNIVY